mmetsp:Transcript_118422/g.166471  ORF Transcript_118422/g.166471 Transcript_118422/m.166471 type:complete len:219 (+) Transcript_118422:107-763(+)
MRQDLVDSRSLRRVQLQEALHQLLRRRGALVQRCLVVLCVHNLLLVREGLDAGQHDVHGDAQTPEIHSLGELTLWQLHELNGEGCSQSTEDLRDRSDATLSSGAELVEILNEGHLEDLLAVDVRDGPAVTNAEARCLASGLDAVHHGALAIRSLRDDAEARALLLRRLEGVWAVRGQLHTLGCNHHLRTHELRCHDLGGANAASSDGAREVLCHTEVD